MIAVSAGMAPKAIPLIVWTLAGIAMAVMPVAARKHSSPIVSSPAGRVTPVKAATPKKAMRPNSSTPLGMAKVAPVFPLG